LKRLVTFILYFVLPSFTFGQFLQVIGMPPSAWPPIGYNANFSIIVHASDGNTYTFPVEYWAHQGQDGRMPKILLHEMFDVGVDRIEITQDPYPSRVVILNGKEKYESTTGFIPYIKKDFLIRFFVKYIPPPLIINKRLTMDVIETESISSPYFTGDRYYSCYHPDASVGIKMYYRGEYSDLSESKTISWDENYLKDEEVVNFAFYEGHIKREDNGCYIKSFQRPTSIVYYSYRELSGFHSSGSYPFIRIHPKLKSSSPVFSLYSFPSENIDLSFMFAPEHLGRRGVPKRHYKNVLVDTSISNTGIGWKDLEILTPDLNNGYKLKTKLRYCYEYPNSGTQAIHFENVSSERTPQTEVCFGDTLRVYLDSNLTFATCRESLKVLDYNEFGLDDYLMSVDGGVSFTSLSDASDYLEIIDTKTEGDDVTEVKFLITQNITGLLLKIKWQYGNFYRETIPLILNSYASEPMVDYSYDDIPCFGEKTSININAITGGVKPYRIGIGNIATCDDGFTGNLTDDCIEVKSDILVEGEGEFSPFQFGGLTKGEYAVYVENSDAKCFSYQEFSIIEPPKLELDYNVGDVQCFGESNGRIRLQAKGGNGGYKFTLTGATPNLLPNEGTDTYLREDLSQGNYTIDATDKNGCKVNDADYHLKDF